LDTWLSLLKDGGANVWVEDRIDSIRFAKVIYFLMVTNIMTRANEILLNHHPGNPPPTLSTIYNRSITSYLSYYCNLRNVFLHKPHFSLYIMIGITECMELHMVFNRRTYPNNTSRLWTPSSIDSRTPEIVHQRNRVDGI